MAPSGGYHMVPKAVKAVKYAISRSSDFLRVHLSRGGSIPTAHAQLAYIPARTGIPKHPIALLRQSRARLSHHGRFFSTAVRHLRTTFPSAFNPNFTATVTRTAVRSALPTSATRSALAKSPFIGFASPLRPNLTGGALPRTAGGYSIGGGARHFSHTASTQAQVVQNVHAGIRAFFTQGKTAIYSGNDGHGARFRAVEKAEAKTVKAMNQYARGNVMRGTSLDFHITPAVTAIHEESTLNETVLQGLASDFARQLRDLASVRADLKRLSQLGELAVTKPDQCTIRVRFPGCDATVVEALCDEVGVARGIVREDAGWRGLDEDDGTASDHPSETDRDVEMALLFPFAPTQCSPGPYRGSDYASADDPDVDVARYFAHVRAAPSRGVGGLQWHSMLSSERSSRSALDGPFADESSAPLSFAILSSSPHDPGSSPPLEFESLAPSEADSEFYDAQRGPDLELQRTRTVTQNAFGETASYQGVEGIYRFLREIERAEGKT